MLATQKIAQWTNNSTEFRVLQQMSTEIRTAMGERLAEERERLGLKQPLFAALGGAKPRTLQDWERGIAAPGSEFLSAISHHGVDVLYVLTGVHTPASTSSLGPEERALIDDYQHADEEGRAAARRVLASLAKQKTK
jgi:DNA-binding transcriptional regulator YiaG